MNDAVIIFCAFSFVCRAQLWADILFVLYSACIMNVLSRKTVYSQHFSNADLYLLNLYAYGGTVGLYRVTTTVPHIQGDSGGICTTLRNDSMSDFKQKSSYEHGSDFERLRSYGHFLFPVHALM
jgi:hypothetical protein